MITSESLPKTQQALQKMSEEIFAYAKEHQADTQALFGSEKTDEEKLFTLLHEVVTQDHIVNLVSEELEDVKEQERVYKTTHPNFKPITAAVNLATKFFNESPDETIVTISMIEDGNEIQPYIGIRDKAKAWYRFTRNDIDYYIDRVDYFNEYLELLQYIKDTAASEQISEEDKEVISSFLVERREYWQAQEEEKALRGQDVGEIQLYIGIYQALIEKIVDAPGEKEANID